MLFKKKIPVTKEMIRQSALWANAEEDLSVVKALFEDIMATAKRKGFKGCYDIQVLDGDEHETICYVYDNEEQRENAHRGVTDCDYDAFGYPLALIKYVENKLNN